MRTPISKRLRLAIFKRDGFQCQYCGAGGPGVILHVDHVLAVARGGENDPENLVTACRDCNLGKSTSTVNDVPGRRPVAPLIAVAERFASAVFPDWGAQARVELYAALEAAAAPWMVQGLILESDSWATARVSVQYCPGVAL